MRVLLLLLSLFVASDAFAVAETKTWSRLWQLNDPATTAGQAFFPCYNADSEIGLAVTGDNIRFFCYAPAGHRIHITEIGLSFFKSAEIGGRSISISVDGTKDSTSTIEMGDTTAPTCDDSFLAGGTAGLLDAIADYCVRYVSIDVDPGSYWYVEVGSNAGSLDGFNKGMAWVRGDISVCEGTTCATRLEPRRQDKIESYTFQMRPVQDDSMSSGVFTSPCHFDNKLLAGQNKECVALVPMYVTEVSLTVLARLTNSGECGKFVIEVNDAAQSGTEIFFGEGHTINLDATMDCDLDSADGDSDLDDEAFFYWETCRRRLHPVLLISPGDSWNYAFYNGDPTHGTAGKCTANLTELQSVAIGMEFMTK